MRKLATIRRVKAIKPIPNADKIEVAAVDGWEVVVKKGEFKEGDLGVYFEIDSFLPILPEFEFLRASSFKVDAAGKEGFRLKTIKLRGQLSQGLMLPLAAMKMQIKGDTEHMVLGQDITHVLGVTLYEPPIPASLGGEVVGPMPSFIRKTDQERVQNIDIDQYKGFYEVTEKIDGTSATFYYNDGKFGVCGRNWEYKPTTENTYWKVAKRLDLERKMGEYKKNIAIQGEIFGEGIQGNPLNVKGQKFMVFDIWDIDAQRYILPTARLLIICEFGLTMVPVVDIMNVRECIQENVKIVTTINDILEMANGMSKITTTARREGLVFKCFGDSSLSFKAVSNAYLLKEEREKR